jgi:hypothetical protein
LASVYFSRIPEPLAGDHYWYIIKADSNLPHMSETKDFSDFKNPKAADVDILVQALDRAYHRPGLMMWRSFLHGFMAALGATIGTALFFTILLYILQGLGGVELLRPSIEKIQDIVIPASLRDTPTATPTPTPGVNR